MISEEAKRAIARIRAGKNGPKLTLADDRASWIAGALAQELPPGTSVTPEVADGVPGEWVETPGVKRDRVIFQMHGGGYNAGSPITHRKLAAYKSLTAKVRVLTPEYRLAPEHPFPAGPEDGLSAYRWLIGQGIAPVHIVMSGDSAGGGLALTMLLMLRDAGEPLPAAAVLLSPWTDLTASSPSFEANRELDPGITQQGLRDAAAWYADVRDHRDPLLSPMFADLHGLPPMLIHAGGDEVMVDDSRILAQRARVAGVDVTYREWPGLWHVHHQDVPEVPESVQAVEEISAFIRARLGDAAA